VIDDRARYGVLDRLADGRSRLRFSRVLRHPPEMVWRAVTEPEHLAAWFPTTIEGERASGALLRFSFPEDRAEPMHGRMLAYEPPSLIEIEWGTDVVRIEVRPHPLGAELTLFDTLDAHGKAARDAAGWHVCLDALQLHLEGDPSARGAMEAWRDVHPRYVEDLGPDAATIGPPEGF
jgi:uncharacterized protein YndB with AHSA1/START domain